MAAGREYRVVVTNVRREQVVARVVESSALSTEPEVAVTVLQSLLPNPDFDSVIEGTTAVGMSRLVAVQAARSIRRSGPDRRPRWQAIAVSAAAQSHRGRIPEILGPMPLAEALDFVTEKLLVLDPAAPVPLAAPLGGSAVCLAVGPEGGWTEAELEALSRAGGKAVNLGPRILRARLAPVIATAILVAQS